VNDYCRVFFGDDTWVHAPSLAVALFYGSSVCVFFSVFDRLLCGVFNLVIAVWLGLFVASVCIDLSLVT
jgi:hypothetical protein